MQHCIHPFNPILSQPWSYNVEPQASSTPGGIHNYDIWFAFSIADVSHSTYLYKLSILENPRKWHHTIGFQFNWRAVSKFENFFILLLVISIGCGSKDALPLPTFKKKYLSDNAFNMWKLINAGSIFF